MNLGLRVLGLAGAASLLLGCNRSVAPDLADCRWPVVPEAEPVAAFSAGDEGSGSFGFWDASPWGLPEYVYTLDQAVDPRADWPNTERRMRRDHWSLVGNLRLSALAYNEGWIDVHTQERGLVSLTRADPEHGQWGGGWSWVDVSGDDREGWASAWAWRPAQSASWRSFGPGWTRQGTCDGAVGVMRTVWAPEGDHGFLVEDIALTNYAEGAIELDHTTVWDVNRHAYVEQLLRSGVVAPHVPARMDEERRRLNDKFVVESLREPRAARIRHTLATGAMPAEATRPADEDLAPPDAFLAALTPGDDVWILDGAAFVADGDRPRLVDISARDLARGSAADQPGMLAARRRLRIAAGETVRLRYAFGAVPPGGTLPDLTAFHSDAGDAAFARSLTATAALLPRTEVDATAVPGGEIAPATLDRELAWHAAMLRNLGGYQDYYEHFVVNQGSAYWYLQGLDGAVRDFVFIAAALAWIDPVLAEETLRYAARMRFGATGALAYTASNAGKISDAGGLHSRPSDLDLFWWWGLAELAAATGRGDILAAEEPLWPKHEYPARPLLEHVRIGLRYLVDEIGIGTHGLIKVGSGDWDDSITFFADSRADAEAHGESIANAAMAAFIAPWMAAMVGEAGEVTMAAELAALGRDQHAAVAAQWTGDWYLRAWFGPDKPFGEDVLFLFSSALAMIAAVPDAERGGILSGNLDRYLIDPSTTSMFQFWYLSPPDDVIPGATDAGSANPAITALGLWGLGNYDRDLAWQGLWRNTMARRAEIYPDLWYGIWSGPDAQYTNVHKDAGQTWASPATPMRDHPVLNSNQHVGPLLGAIRLAGLEPATAPTADGPRPALRIGPRVPVGVRWTLDLPLARVETGTDFYAVELRPQADGVRRLRPAPPPGAAAVGPVTVNGAPVALDAWGTLVLTVRAGAPLRIEVRGAD